MKFEIELTEEEAKNFSERSTAAWTAVDKISKQLTEQLHKEKPWQDRYKFLVGYIDPNPLSLRVRRGGLWTVDVPTGECREKIYGFTKEMLVGFRIDAANDHHVGYDLVEVRIFIDRWLKEQEVEG